jgi:GNAT superfamily N-acetyltransferase
MSELAIRPATALDAELISAIVAESARNGIGPSLSHAGLAHLLAAMTAEKMKERIDSGAFQFFISELETPVAVSAVRLPTHLYYLFVAPSYQGQGIGRRLWQHAQSTINRLSQRAVREITVNSSPNAIGAYERFGFTKVGLAEEQNEVKYQPMVWKSHSAQSKDHATRSHEK